MGLLDLFRGKKHSKFKSKKRKCPNCGETVDLTMKRCPKCGVRIKSMFRIRCPRCKTLNEIDAKRCVNCGNPFEEEKKQKPKTYFVCPICGYRMTDFLTQCPVCGTRFV